MMMQGSLRALLAAIAAAGIAGCPGEALCQAKLGPVADAGALGKQGQSEADTTIIYLEQRGKALRAALQARYESLTAHGWDNSHGPHADVTEMVLPFFPNGTPISDAEVILRSAGFVVDCSFAQVTLASIPFFYGNVLCFCRVDAYIELAGC